MPGLARRAKGGGAGLAKGGTGYGRHGARKAPAKGKGGHCTARRRAGLACPRRAAAGRIEEREGRPATGRQGAKGGACAVPLHGEALGKRKAPHGAGLVRGRIDRGLFTGGGLEAA